MPILQVKWNSMEISIIFLGCLEKAFSSKWNCVSNLCHVSKVRSVMGWFFSHFRIILLWEGNIIGSWNLVCHIRYLWILWYKTIKILADWTVGVEYVWNHFNPLDLILFFNVKTRRLVSHNTLLSKLLIINDRFYPWYNSFFDMSDSSFAGNML